MFQNKSAVLVSRACRRMRFAVLMLRLLLAAVILLPELSASGRRATCEWITSGTVVFRGRMLYGGKLDRDGVRCERPARFFVSEQLHGFVDLPTVVAVDACEFGFLGGSYIVGAAVLPDGSLKGPPYELPIWMGEPAARETLAFLRRVRDQPEPATIAGTVEDGELDSVAGAVVAAIGSLGAYRTLSDKDGSFEFRTLLPGSYEVQVTPPAERGLRPSSYRLQPLLPGACDWRIVFLEAKQQQR